MSPELRALPHNLDAEFALLGCVILDNEALGRVDGVEARHFHERLNGALWAFVVEKIGALKLVEPVLIDEAFKDNAAYHEIGGIRFIADLVDQAPPAANAPDYAEIILDLALRRELIRIGSDVCEAADSAKGSGKEHLEAAEHALFALAETGSTSGGIVSFGDALDEALDMAAKAYACDGGISGLSTGLVDLDQKLGGLHPSGLIILAGRPSMGKTALATNIAFHAAKHGSRVLFFSLEMSKAELSQRLLAEVTGISSDRQRKGQIDASEFGKLRDAADEIRASPLRIDDTGGLAIHKLSARARREKRRNGLDLIVVDYLQLVTTGERNASRVQEVSTITQALKALAKDLSVPVVALSQLSRQVEAREDKRPQLSDLRESGSIEQDADVVMFVYREAYYLGRAEPDPQTSQAKHFEWTEKMSACQGLAEVIIGKQRHGPIGTVRLAFNESLTKFGNLAREGHPANSPRYPYAVK